MWLKSDCELLLLCYAAVKEKWKIMFSKDVLTWLFTLTVKLWQPNTCEINVELLPDRPYHNMQWVFLLNTTGNPKLITNWTLTSGSLLRQGDKNRKFHQNPTSLLPSAWRKAFIRWTSVPVAGRMKSQAFVMHEGVNKRNGICEMPFRYIVLINSKRVKK